MAAKEVATDAERLRKKTEERAYALWEGEGKPHGRQLEHWLRAEVETTVALETASIPNTPQRSAAANAVRKKARSRKR